MLCQLLGPGPRIPIGSSLVAEDAAGRDEAAVALAAVVAARPAAVDNPTMLRSLLSDQLGERGRALRAECDLLVAGADEQVPARVGEGVDPAIEALALASRRGLNDDTARWVCNTWAVAIGARPVSTAGSASARFEASETERDGSPGPTLANVISPSGPPGGLEPEILTRRSPIPFVLVALGTSVAVVALFTDFAKEFDDNVASGHGVALPYTDTLRKHFLDFVRLATGALVVATIAAAVAAFRRARGSGRVARWLALVATVVAVVVFALVALNASNDGIHPWRLATSYYVAVAGAVLALVGAIYGMRRASRRPHRLNGRPQGAVLR
jgi:hypothetical protein